MRELSAFEATPWQPGYSFGTIHTWWGTEPREAFMSRGGTFSAILRDPIRRLHSLFSHHYLHDVKKLPAGHSSQMHYDELVENGDIGPPQNLAINEIRNDPFSETEDWFIALCWQILESDLDVIDNCTPRQVLKHEDLVGSHDGLRDGLRRILDTETIDDFPGAKNYFDQVVNRHAATPLSSTEIFQRWPEKLKKMFVFNMLGLDVDKIKKAYAQYDYAFPTELFSWLDNELARSREF